MIDDKYNGLRTAWPIFCIYASGNEVMIKVWYKKKWIITKSSHYPFYNFLLKVITSTINYYLSPVSY
ncbi:hypothetical protein ADH74_16535 [Bacteroides caecimuris]|nr:hypothetical protein ADH74_16535 [Bacteroides caecimuris]